MMFVSDALRKSFPDTRMFLCLNLSNQVVLMDFIWLASGPPLVVREKCFA